MGNGGIVRHRRVVREQGARRFGEVVGGGGGRGRRSEHVGIKSRGGGRLLGGELVCAWHVGCVCHPVTGGVEEEKGVLSRVGASQSTPLARQGYGRPTCKQVGETPR